MHTHCCTHTAVADPVTAPAASHVQVLVVVEGVNDVEFLRRISRIVHAANATLPDLGALELEGRLIFLPVGGSDMAVWSRRLAPLALREFHLADRDVPPLTEEHQAAVEEVNRRPGCIAALTGKRHTENYVHAQAIFQARGLHVEFGSDHDLPELVARRTYELLGGQHHWDDIPSRKRRQMKHRAKRWLNTDAVDAMTTDLLAAQDPDGDVCSWLEAIHWLMDS
ncbi:MAG: ATP-dependent endonuclease [Planctomycetes bacterium]|nr:ATP-dependent endonuclease [Planctomycetota bacterium]